MAFNILATDNEEQKNNKIDQTPNISPDNEHISKKKQKKHKKAIKYTHDNPLPNKKEMQRP